jgi:hypothetical protein
LATYRKLRADEIALIQRLLAFGGREDLVVGLDAAEVRAIPGEETGSLVFASSNQGQRKFGDVVATAEAEDSDGTLILFALNLDRAGALYELDIWKDDYSRVISLPEPSRLRK